MRLRVGAARFGWLFAAFERFLLPVALAFLLRSTAAFCPAPVVRLGTSCELAEDCSAEETS